MCSVYEFVILFGIFVAVGLVMLPMLRWSGPLVGARLTVFQIVLFIVFGVYFTVCWQRGGQTLPMKTLDLRVQRAADGLRLPWSTAWLRYVLGWSGLLAGGAVLSIEPTAHGTAFLAFAATSVLLQAAAAFGPSYQALHDRMIGTEVVVVAR